MQKRKIPTIRRLRQLALAALTILLALLLYVQVSQHLLRHRAERLHAEILALQLHPGTFADIQRLQKEWGAFAEHKGECTPHHCILEIEFKDSLLRLAKWLPPSGFWFQPNFLIALSSAFGGHPAKIGGNVRIHDDRVWEADFYEMIFTGPGVGRNRSTPYAVIAGTHISPRLGSAQAAASYQVLQRGYDATFVLICLGCEETWVRFTPTTDPNLVRKFNLFNDSCLTRWSSCKHPDDLAPNIFAEAHSYDDSPEVDEPTSCLISPSLMAREASEILLVRALSITEVPIPNHSQPRLDVTFHVLSRPKNNPTDTRETFQMAIGLMGVRGFNGKGSRILHPGELFYLLLTQWDPHAVTQPTIEGCNAIPYNSHTTVQIEAGIAADASAGNPDSSSCSAIPQSQSLSRLSNCLNWPLLPLSLLQ